MRLSYPRALLVPIASLTLSIFVFIGLFSAQIPSVSAESPSFVRVIHASPYVGTTDVFVDGVKLLSSFGFGSVTDYAPIPAGPHDVQLALVGKGIGAAAIKQALVITPGTAYTVAAIGATATSLSLKVFIDDNVLAAGTAKVRVYHLSPDSGPVSVTTGSNTVLNSILYQEASTYLAIPAGLYVFNVNATQVNTALPISETLKANTVTSIFTVGLFNGTPKLELVPAQVDGLPGVPGTGSDPNVPSTNSQPLTSWLPWLLGTLVLVTVGAGVITRRRAVVR